jgi:hypothetical protein
MKPQMARAKRIGITISIHHMQITTSRVHFCPTR